MYSSYQCSPHIFPHQSISLLYHKIVKNAILFLQYNREGFALACGLGQGAFWQPHRAVIHFAPVRIPFRYKNNEWLKPLVVFMAEREGFVLDFCSTFRILFYVMFRKNLRSPFQNNTPCCFVHCVRIPAYILTKKQESTLKWGCFLAFWRRERDSNPRVR